MASAILLAGVLAVAVALVGGAKTSMEAQRRMEAALIAEEQMGQIAATDYASLSGLLPFRNIGQFFVLTTTQQLNEDLPGLGVRVAGTRVSVVVAQSGSQLAEAELFIPEPQS